MTNETPVLADILDREDRLKVMERWGGAVLRIPTPDNIVGHELREVLGAKKARQLATNYGGQRVYIPTMGTANRRERDELIREKRAAGSTIRELANEFGLSSRMIHYLCEDVTPR
jgi:Mor family transcriptional regulator